MPKRRILWFPERGIDKTLPKHGETTSAIDRVDTCTYAYAADDLSVYNSRDVVTRRDLKSSNATDYSTIYAIKKYSRGVAVAGSNGIYLDGTLKKSVTLSAIAYLAPWYQSIYYSTGSAMGYIASDDTDYALGIDAPGSWAAKTSRFLEIYSDSGINGSWNAATNTLTSAGAGFTSALIGDYIQVYQHTETTCFTGRVQTVPTPTTLTILVDPDETKPATDASGAIYFYISPNRWITYTGYVASGGVIASDGVSYPNSVSYRQRFYRSGDGGRSNSAVHPLFEMVVNSLVGGIRVSSIDDSSSDANVDMVEIFRQDSSVTTSVLYRKVGEVALGTTTLDDTTTMSASLEALDDDNKYPCPYTLANLCFYVARLWGTYANRVYYSEAYITEPRFGYFGPIGENYFEFSDTVKAIVPDERRLVVFLERETFVLEGLDPDAMNVSVMNEDIGTYSSTSAERFGGRIFTVSADFKFYAIDGSAWTEVAQISSVLTSSPSYYEVRGSDNNLWISSGAQVHKMDLSNSDLWTYTLSGRLGTGSHTTYIGSAGRLYELDATGGSESTPSAYLESPDIYIGDATGRRGLFNRLFFRVQVATCTVSVYIDGALWKTMTVNAPDERNVHLHFYPARGYYAKVVFTIPQYNEFKLTSRVILNPW